MNSATQLHDRASDIVEAARDFQAAAEEPASHAAAPDSLAALEEALQVLSAAWYRVAADAAPGIGELRRGRDSGSDPHARGDGLSREQEAHLVATLHDIAAAFASCARACREGRSKAAPIIARRMAATPRPEDGARDDLAWFETCERPTQRVA